jgi:hypothetical protein
MVVRPVRRLPVRSSFRPIGSKCRGPDCFCAAATWSTSKRRIAEVRPIGVAGEKGLSVGGERQHRNVCIRAAKAVPANCTDQLRQPRAAVALAGEQGIALRTEGKLDKVAWLHRPAQ